MKIWINVAAAALLLFLLRKADCHTITLQDEASDLANLQNSKTVQRIEDTTNDVNRLVIINSEK